MTFYAIFLELGHIFGCLLMSPLGLKAKVGFHIFLVQANIMYVRWDPPLALQLLTSLMAGFHQPSSSQNL